LEFADRIIALEKPDGSRVLEVRADDQTLPHNLNMAGPERNPRLLTDEEVQEVLDKEDRVYHCLEQDSILEAQDKKTHEQDCKDFADWLEPRRIAPGAHQFFIMPEELEMMRREKMIGAKEVQVCQD